MKVLIVDDNPLMREMIQMCLPLKTCETREISDGVAALASYREFLPDFVLMDWQMKEMDGLTATRSILDSFPKAQVLIITQFDDAELRAAASEAGAVGFVAKDELQKLRSLLLHAQL